MGTRPKGPGVLFLPENCPPETQCQSESFLPLSSLPSYALSSTECLLSISLCGAPENLTPWGQELGPFSSQLCLQGLEERLARRMESKAWETRV